jgi:hypothetical protein
VQTLAGTIFSAPANRSRFLQSLDLTTQAWTFFPIGDQRDGRMAPAPAVYYDTGLMLRVGSDEYRADYAAALTTARVLDFTDPQNPVERFTNPMSYARNRGTPVLLPDGTVLVHGGRRASPCNGSKGDPNVYHPEIWDPATEQWTTMGPMQIDRVYHSTALLLRDGSILSAGGNPHHESSQIFHPPYLYKGPRPIIISAPSEVEWGTTFDVVTPDPASIRNVHLLKLGAVTHAYDQSQRMARLNFTAAADHLTVSAPANGYEAPPGYYMLFLISDLGVPSVAEYVRLFGDES